MSSVIQAYRFVLDPTEVQAAALSSHCGGQRAAFNWGLARVKANLAQREAERSYGVAEDELTPSLNWSFYSLRKDWNAAKHEVAPWWADNSKEAYATGLANLADALNIWNAGKKGQRKGRKAGFPRFKSKHRDTPSCRFSTGAFGLSNSDRRHVKLPRIGVVRTHESTRKLARHIERGTARVRSATVSWRRGRWQVSLSVDIERDEPKPATRGGTVGVDLGVKSLAVLSTGEIIANPKHLDAAQRKLRRLQRQAARRWTPGLKPDRQSKRWHQTQDRIRRLHTYVANARQDGLHKLSTRLVSEFDTIVGEDLHVAGMLHNRTLSRSIADVGMGELRRQITYKTTWNGRTLVIADRWYPSSKTCSACGVVKAKLRLSERTFHCGECALVLNRDLNAACNLAALAGEVACSTSSQSCGATENEPDGNPCKTAASSGAPGNGYRHGKTTPSVVKAT
ncbi:IS607 family element RNA-guided endonuclease TnpB [Haloactinomyces albus]|uniref:Transposase n=1 Tax=Haloactinomyces albus TaxID=1352928 RepID=A0AAE3ZHF8_9ACTN|nr:IS607 family element RNA-guided endonuclease TnpB [Haloactinomyces albus]MDR7303740.1 putative transposase [Haloactinomyces albus]